MTVLRGDCVEVMAGMEPESVDAIVTDPPYGLEFMGKEWDRLWDGREARAKAETFVGSDGATRRKTTGFSAHTASPTYQAGAPAQRWHEEWGRAALRIAQPGAYLLAFGGTRTVHRMTCALEDAGWVIRDMLVWAYASGFPKSYNTGSDDRFCHCEPTPEYDVRRVFKSDVPQAVDAGGGAGQVLQPTLPQHDAPAEATGPVASAPGTGEPSLEGRGNVEAGEGQLPGSALRAGTGVGATYGASGRLHHGAPAGDGRVDGPTAGPDRSGEPREPRSERQPAGEPDALAGQRRPQARRGRADCARCGKPLPPRGLGSALKPAWEPIVMARKPMVGSLAENWIAHGTGSLNIDQCRIPGTKPVVAPIDSDKRQRNILHTRSATGTGEMTTEGRFPSNLVLTDPILDGGWEGVVGGGETSGVSAGVRGRNQFGLINDDGWSPTGAGEPVGYGDSGTYSRFFLIPKAPTSERVLSDGRRSPHPTQKPEALIRHLVNLVTPTGGLVLDPFLGSGTLGVVCDGLGMRWLGIEREAEYADWAEDRIADGRPAWMTSA